jgi:hypothetical protein
MVRRRLHLSGMLACMSLATGACLPRGEPPAGRQFLSDPTAALLAVIPSGSDGMRQVLFFRPSQRQDPELVDLWALTLDANDEPSPERMLFPGIASGLQLSYRPAAGSTSFPLDARGRIYVVTDQGDDLFRIDVATGEKEDLGPGLFPLLSPSGQRVLTQLTAGGYTLHEADDQTLVIMGSQAQFVGETLFYLSPDCTLMRVTAGAPAQPVASDIANYYPARGTLLFVRHTSGGACNAQIFTGPSTGTQGLLDLATLQETPLPGELQFNPGNISSDGHWMTAYRFDEKTRRSELVIVDLTTGGTEALGPSVGAATWRPGKDELWLSTYDESQPGLSGASLSIKTPGQEPPLTVPGVFPSGFNEDGRYWLSRGAAPDQLVSSDLVGLADDPTGPRQHAVPEGSSLEFLQTLGDGRLLVGSLTSLDDFRNSDYQLVDPRNGATSTLALRGYLSAVGNSRLLGIFHYVFERGDLTAVDFATGHQTILAGEYAMAAVVEPNVNDSDGFPPNARVVYQFRARFDSPWSGLWLATAP